MLFIIIPSIVFLLLINTNCYLFDSDDSSFDLIKCTLSNDTTEIVFDSLNTKGYGGYFDSYYYHILLNSKDGKYGFEMFIKDTIVDYIVIPSGTYSGDVNRLYFKDYESGVTYYLDDWYPLSKGYIFIDEFPDAETHTGFLSGTFTGTFQMENSDSIIEIDNGYFQIVF